LKKFTFRLQTVLEMREKELEDKQQEMASIVKVLNDQIEELQKIQTREKDILASLDQMYNSEEIDILTISGSKNFLIKLANDGKNQNRIIQNTRNIIKIKQQEINEAYKKVKVLEKLKEKQEKEYYQAFEKKEAMEIDDLVTTRYKVS